MKISLEEIKSHPLILSNDREILSFIERLNDKDLSQIEEVLSEASLSLMAISPADEDELFYEQNMEKLKASLGQWQHSMARAWDRSFPSLHMRAALEYLCSGLVGKPMQMRTTSVLGIDPVSGNVVTVYPDAKQLPKLIENLSSFYAIITEFPATASMIICNIYLLKMHMFEDGNSRTARAFMDLVLRDLGITNQPVLCLSIPVYSNIQYLNSISNEVDIISQICRFQNVLIKYLTFCDTHI